MSRLPLKCFIVSFLTYSYCVENVDDTFGNADTIKVAEICASYLREASIRVGR